ncbi:MAG TPA: hypothetical protein VIJ22_06660 [Polyangiaceae bacterium]
MGSIATRSTKGKRATKPTRAVRKAYWAQAEPVAVRRLAALLAYATDAGNIDSMLDSVAIDAHANWLDEQHVDLTRQDRTADAIRDWASGTYARLATDALAGSLGPVVWLLWGNGAGRRPRSGEPLRAVLEAPMSSVDDLAERDREELRRELAARKRVAGARAGNVIDFLSARERVLERRP